MNDLRAPEAPAVVASTEMFFRSRCGSTVRAGTQLAATRERGVVAVAEALAVVASAEMFFRSRRGSTVRAEWKPAPAERDTALSALPTGCRLRTAD